MTTRKRPEADKVAKKNKRLSLNKKTLKDLKAKDKGPIGGGRQCTLELSNCR